MNVKANENTVPKKLAIVDSGLSGFIAARDLLQQGHKVSLYTDRTSKDWLEKFSPTGTVFRFSSSQDLEHQLSINFWKEFEKKDGLPLMYYIGKQRELKKPIR